MKHRRNGWRRTAYAASAPLSQAEITCLAGYRRMVESQAGAVDLFLCETLSLARGAGDRTS